ncbi:MAG: response regulator transcription factor [Desulfobacterales bacterium]|nr:response regulator transcription factor [Desulfobacterales bacterium]
MSEKRILVIEDEDATRYLCEALLRKEGYQVMLAENGTAGMTALAVKRFDMVLLDLNLPDGDGLDLAGQISRLADEMPILMMTVRNRPEERMEGFESGAKDYLVKPFHPGELIHRVRNILAGNRNPRSEKNRTCHTFGSWILDAESRMFRADDGRRMELTRGEFDLMAELAGKKDRAVDRFELLDIVTRGESEGHPRTVDVLISRIRRKIGQEPDIPVTIKTVPGIGYRLITPQ